MVTHLKLARPLAVIDLETTGKDIRDAHIVEISVLRVENSGARDHRTRRLNPGIPIPPEATTIHGIRDEDVAHEPSFADKANGLLQLLDGCDLCELNLKKFDLRILYSKFQRADFVFDMAGRAIVDPMEIFHQMKPRHLAAAVRHYRQNAEVSKLLQ